MTEKILVVESDLAAGLELVMEIERLGYEAVGLTDRAEEALEIAYLLEPELALIEIDLSGTLDGIHTARLLRRASQIPTIFLTAEMDPPRFARAEEAFPMGYLSKPPKREELKAVIEFALRHTQERRENRKRQRNRRILVERGEEVTA